MSVPDPPDPCIEQVNAVAGINAEIAAAVAALDVLLQTLDERLEALAQCREQHQMMAQSMAVKDRRQLLSGVRDEFTDLFKEL